jgi:hypothetical protein
MAETMPGPSFSGSVVLDLGPGQGALVLHTPPELDGLEIEISPLGDEHVRRTHSQVRQRRTGVGVLYAAVYPELPPGEYAVWGESDQRAMTVTINGGVVTTATLTDQPGPAGHDHPGHDHAGHVHSHERAEP